MGTIEVLPVRTRAEMRMFIDFPWAVYADFPLWVPPVKSLLARQLTPGKHPFWLSAQRELFLARRNGKTVGRIAAIVDDRYNAQHCERLGTWGFFECLPDVEASLALFQAAEAWCRDQGLSAMRGPLNPSMNYEVGLLLKGFDAPPAFMMPYTPPYYLELVRGCGYAKEKDLYSYRFTSRYEPPAWMLDVATRLSAKEEIEVVTFSSRDALVGAMEEMRLLYNQCWSDNWGFVPMSPEESREMASSMKHIADPRLVFFLRHRERLVGVALLVPDINPFLKRLDGKLGLAALYHRTRHWRSDIRGIRGLVFGILAEYRQMGLPLVAFNYLFTLWRANPHYEYIELGWNLEDNFAINRLYEENGVMPEKHYRIYRKALS